MFLCFEIDLMQIFYGLNVCFQLSKYIVCQLRGIIFKMALYHGGENDVEFVPSCPRLRVQLGRMRISKECLWDILTFP
jgi:hypothetical protein